jgi:hypothetical protein
MWGKPILLREPRQTTESVAVLAYFVWCLVVALGTSFFALLSYLPETESVADKHAASLGWCAAGIAALLVGAGVALGRTHRPLARWQWLGAALGVACAVGGAWWIWVRGSALTPFVLLLVAPVVSGLGAGGRPGAGRMILIGSLAAATSVILVAGHAAH